MAKRTYLAGAIVLLFALALAAFSVGVRSSTAAYAEEPRCCAEEIEKFCKDVKPGEGRIAKCLKEHENELSEACKGKCEEVSTRLKDVRQACAEDVERFCKDVQPGEGRIAKCLRKHENEISSVCKESLGRARGTAGEKKQSGQ